MPVVVQVVAVVVGVALIAIVIDSAVRTFMVPRGVVSVVTRGVFTATRRGFRMVTAPMDTYEARDRAMALYVPVSLIALVLTWMVLVAVGFTLLFRVFVFDEWSHAFEMSGSSFFTLGFVRPPVHAGDVGYLLAFMEAATGLAVLALIIGFLPTIYGVFSRREVQVARLGARANTPPSAVDMLVRYHEVGWLNDLPRLWEEWENWFSELGETHTTFGMLPFMRSPNAHRSWVTASGAILDAAALAQSTLNVPWSPQAGMCIRSGYLALRDISSFFRIPFDPDPAPEDPISIDRAEFLDAYERLGAAGVPLRTDRDRAWRDFAGWRVNYDAVLLGLAGLTMAPYAPWSSDRSLRPTRRRRHR